MDQLQTGLASIDREFTGEGDCDNRMATLRPLIENTHDLAYMARLTIRAHWSALDDDQRVRFVNAFVDLSVTTYAARFRDLSEVRFRTGERREMPRGRSEVQTVLIQANGTTVALNYLLHDTNDGRRIINVLADGVSELALKRTQYQKVLETRDFDALLEYMRQQRDDLISGGDG